MISITRAILLCSLASLAWVIPASADKGRAELDQRIEAITAKFEAMQADPKVSIPKEKLEQAHAILLLDRTKAGFLFAYQGGMGVAMAKDEKSGTRSAISFYKAEEASVGFQVGVQQSFVVALFMDADAAKQLTRSQMVVGGEARGTAGDESTGTEAGTHDDHGSVLVFYDREGVYGGAAVKGGTVDPDEDADRRYYGRAVSSREILFENKVTASKTAVDLAVKIQAQTRVASKEKD